MPQHAASEVPVLSEEVREALAARRPVVALESTILAHGLPRPRNLAVGLELEELVRAEGAVPATVAVVDGVAYAGLDKARLERIAAGEGVRKLGHRDLAPALAAGAEGVTAASTRAFLSSQSDATA
ncbi:pseudouridine-5'-phosphate glycosidase, partial [Streptomyces sp. NPDC059525]|uniref:pseudouridine-5'-phosphate glycosidase n=1 Tax=Streptomyces sp. NPDC059525 TaxID=3346857 RepID=UPI0036C88A00